MMREELTARTALGAGSANTRVMARRRDSAGKPCQEAATFQVLRNGTSESLAIDNFLAAAHNLLILSGWSTFLRPRWPERRV